MWDTKMAAFYQEETLLYQQEYAWLCFDSDGSVDVEMLNQCFE